jgi:Dyp-type peroxidase family
LPQEFMDGMESRAGLLGDVRGNHPDYWPRPERCNEKLEVDKSDRVDLSTVHAVLVMRLADAANTSADLHPRLAAEVAKLAPQTTGLQVVAVQPTRSNREGPVTREHFGFIDGISQPGVKGIAPAPLPRDEVPPGDLCLGYDNSRDVVPPDPDPVDALLVDGSFLVVRKLRQRVDRLTAVVDKFVAQTGLSGAAADAKRSELLAKMMGRSQGGVPLVPPNDGPTGNDFDFTSDTDGSKCPFHAHIRRSNPRDGRPHMPRLLRRGMSYGPRGSDAATERGIVFMAYCASIAEQFEIIQRWIAGGNSTGVSAAQADPFLAVPQPGEKRTFRYLDGGGNVVRVDLGEDPFATLEWGMYLFVPSLKVLSTLKSFRKLPAKPKAPPKARAVPDPLQPWRRLLEDSDPVRSPAPATWAKVRARPGGRMPAPPYGTLVGRHADVLAVLQDTGAKYSVQGYGKRMSASIGLNHLGMDGAAHDRLAHSINQDIADIDEEKAFAVAAPMVMKALFASMALKQPNPDGSFRMPVDLIALAEKVLAGLCTLWVGLPEADPAKLPPGESPFMVVGGRVDGNPMPPRCPGDLLTASHYTFTPHLKPEVAVAGRAQGDAALKAVEQLLASKRPLGSLAAKIQADLQAIGATQAEIEHSIAGVLLGFPPTVYGNYLRTLETWINEKTLWDCQRQLGDVSAADPYQRAVLALRQQLMATMRKRPVPEMLWRCPVVDGKAIGTEEGVDDDQRIVLGIASALTDAQAPDEMMFGGSRIAGSEVETVHACPGYGMGVGVLLALIAGLLDAGTLRPTGSPVLLMLTPRADWLARATALLQQGASA